MNHHWSTSKKTMVFDLESYFLNVKHWDFKTISFVCIKGKTIVVKYGKLFVLMPVGHHFSMEHPYLTNSRLHLETKPTEDTQTLRIFKAA